MSFFCDFFVIFSRYWTHFSLNFCLASSEVVRILGVKILTDSVLKAACAVTMNDKNTNPQNSMIFLLCLANNVINFIVQLVEAFGGRLHTEGDWILLIGYGTFYHFNGKKEAKS